MALKNADQLNGFKIHATDGELGAVDQLYFDDEKWTIRYLTVKTGSWLNGRDVLISPLSITSVDWDAERVNVLLTKDQVKASPDVDTKRPVSRQHESGYLGFYGYPNYWGGPYRWGLSPSPSPVGGEPGGSVHTITANSLSSDSHLRSTKTVKGYAIHASEGQLGHVSGFVFDDVTWAIRFMEVSTGHWWPGKNVLVSPAWIQRVSWFDSRVYVNLTRELIQSAPAYTESEPITRDYEDRLYRHYRKDTYWSLEPQPESYFVLNGD